jgi:hypothetical protein
MNLMLLYNMTSEEKLTPNQFYVLYCINYGLTSPNINMHQEIRHLVIEDWIVKQESGYTVTPKAASLISKLESYFGVHLKKSNNSIMGIDFEANAEKYNNIFPRIKLGSNKAARAPIKEIIPAFRWFFEEYSYDWETIYKATQMYLETEESKKYKYTRTSKYFIRKQEQDKSWASDLASYCDLVLNGEDYEEDKFTEKVF